MMWVFVCSNLLVMKWKIWSVTWEVILQELLLACLDLQKRVYLSSWAPWASPRWTCRLAEVFPPPPCWTPLLTGWLMHFLAVLIIVLPCKVSVRNKGLWQKTSSVLGKQSYFWDLGDHGHAILGSWSWELDGFCSLAGRNGCFLFVSADPTTDTIAGVYLSLLEEAGWSLIGTAGKWHSPFPACWKKRYRLRE